jgi:hypothetical protein
MCAKEVDGSLLNSLEITINMASPKEDSKFDRKIFSRNQGQTVVITRFLRKDVCNSSEDKSVALL